MRFDCINSSSLPFIYFDSRNIEWNEANKMKQLVRLRKMQRQYGKVLTLIRLLFLLQFDPDLHALMIPLCHYTDNV